MLQYYLQFIEQDLYILNSTHFQLEKVINYSKKKAKIKVGYQMQHFGINKQNMKEEVYNYMRKPSFNIQVGYSIMLSININFILLLYQQQKELNLISRRYDDEEIQFDYNFVTAQETKIETSDNDSTQLHKKNEIYRHDNSYHIIKSRKKQNITNELLEVESVKTEQLGKSFKDNLSIYSRDQTNQEQNMTNEFFSLVNLPQKKDFFYFARLIMNMQKFYRLITKNVCISENITKQQHILINDMASQYGQDVQSKFYNQNNYLRLLTESLIKIKNFQHRIPVFTPYHILKKLWDTLIALLILAVTFLLSLVIFFDLKIVQLRLFFTICLIIFLVDICVTFNTGIFKTNGDILLKRKSIAQNYLQTEFLADQLGLAPLYFLCFDSEEATQFTSIIYFSFLLKFVQLKNIFQRLNFYFSYQRNQKNLLNLIELIFFVVCICHSFCLFWHGLANFQISQGETNTWLHKMNLIDKSVFDRYVYSFYFLSTTMITVGYGDITPQNSLEVVFTIITMFTTGVVYAFSLNTIGSIIDNIKRKEKQYQQNMQAIHQLMREENIDQELRIKISNYFEYQYKEKKKGSIKVFNYLFQIKKKSNIVEKIQQNKVIEKLSSQLKNDLLLQIQGKYLKHIPIIQSMIEKQKISLCMEECQFSPGEFIFKQGQIDDCSIYFIVKGNVSLVFSCLNSDFNIKQFGNSDYFGEISFITGKERSLSAKAFDFCRLYKIKRQDFINVIRENTHDYENFKMMEDQICTNKDYTFSNIKCLSCSQNHHIITECPKIHYKFSEQVYYLRKNYSKSHKTRHNFSRKQYNPINTIQNMKNCLSAIYQINEKDEHYSILNLLEQGIISYSSSSGNDEEEEDQTETNQQYTDSENLINLKRSQINKNQQSLNEDIIGKLKPDSIKSPNRKSYDLGNSLKNLQIESKRSQLSDSESSDSSLPQSNILLSPLYNAQSKKNQNKSVKVSTNESKDNLESLQIPHSQHKIYEQFILSNMIYNSQKDFLNEKIDSKISGNATKQQSNQQISSNKQLLAIAKDKKQQNQSSEKNIKKTSILQNSLERANSSSSNISNTKQGKSNQIISTNNNDGDKGSLQIFLPQFKRQKSSSLKNQINNITAQSRLSNSNYQLSQLIKERNSQLIPITGRKRQTLEQNQLKQVIDQYYQEKQQGSKNFLHIIPNQQILITEIQRIQQVISDFTQQNLGNGSEQFQNPRILSEKSNQYINGSIYEDILTSKSFLNQKQAIKDILDYELLQTFECFKKYAYFYPQNNFTDVIKLCNKYSYENRRKNLIRRKLLGKPGKLVQLGQKIKKKSFISLV